MSAPGLPPLLWVGGTLCDERLWQGVAPALASRVAMQAVAWGDERGIARLAGRILAEAPPRFLIAGMSMGGSIALEVCAQAPGRVAGLALIDSHPFADPPGRAEARQAQLALARQSGLATLVDTLWPAYVHPDRRGDAALRGLVEAMATACGLAAYERQLGLLASRADRTATLARLAVPVLIAAGADDALCPPAWQADMHARNPRAALHLIDGAGHFAVLERPAEMVRALEAWLDAVAAAPPQNG